MAASLPFRSHLMQQFASAARTQSRPPLVLMGTLKSAVSHGSRPSSFTTTAASPSAAPALLGASAASSMANSSSELDLFDESTAGTLHHSHNNGRSVHCQRWKTAPPRLGVVTNTNNDPAVLTPPRRWLTTQPLLHNQEEAEEDDQAHIENNNNNDMSSKQQPLKLLPSKGALAFQSILTSRRTTSRFLPWDATTATTTTNHHLPLHAAATSAMWREALLRAVTCAQHAPNHKRTEPFTFKQMIAPSDSTRRLADIAYHVSMRKKNTTTTHNDDEALERAAQQKRLKWLQIPAFLVTMVSNNQSPTEPPHYHNNNNDSTATADEDRVDPYQPLAFVPPRDERQMEDYASACAAVQNVLLSLHAEGIASKWATGHVIHTPAFRELVQAQPTDRIVALIMIGYEDVNTSTPGRLQAQPQVLQQQQDSTSTTTSSSHVPRRRLLAARGGPPPRHYRRAVSGDLLMELE